MNTSDALLVLAVLAAAAFLALRTRRMLRAEAKAHGVVPKFRRGATVHRPPAWVDIVALLAFGVSLPFLWRLTRAGTLLLFGEALLRDARAGIGVPTTTNDALGALARARAAEEGLVLVPPFLVLVEVIVTFAAGLIACLLVRSILSRLVETEGA